MTLKVDPLDSLSKMAYMTLFSLVLVEKAEVRSRSTVKKADVWRKKPKYGAEVRGRSTGSKYGAEVR